MEETEKRVHSKKNIIAGNIMNNGFEIKIIIEEDLNLEKLR
jgi:hypothetical protein